MGEEIDRGFIIKFVLVSLVVVILPVWVVRFVPLSFLYKMVFTIGGMAGVFWTLKTGKTMRRRK